MSAFLVVVGAAVGAPLRFLVDRWLKGWFGARFPWGTLAVNVVGSGVLGWLAGASVSTPVWTVAGTGFCGALTTYSTFGYDVFRLVENRAYGLAVLNITANLVAGLGAAVLGYAVA